MARSPDARVFAKIEGKRQEDARLIPIGVAWSGESGFTCTVDVVPLAWLRSPSEKLVLQVVRDRTTRKDGDR